MDAKVRNKMKFFGIEKILPFLREERGRIFIMVFFGLSGSLTDIILPLFQRYALDNFVGKGVFDTVAVFILLYLLTILVAAVCFFLEKPLSRLPK